MPPHAIMLCLFAMLAVLFAPADAKTCRMRHKNEVWKHGKGKFVNEGTTTWVEYNKAGEKQATFKAVQQHGTQVILEDKTRNVKILLNEELAGLANSGESQFTHLYNGEWQKIVDCT